MINKRLTNGSLPQDNQSTKDDDLIGFLKSGKYRIPILKILNTEINTPREIVSDLNTSFSQVSRTLTELKENELIACKTPNRNKGKIYGVTEKGLFLLKNIGEINDNEKN